jgi:Lysine methyltransferase
VLRWGNVDDIQSAVGVGPVDLVLVADCVYYRDSLNDLVQTLLELAPNPHTEILLREVGVLEKQ